MLSESWESALAATEDERVRSSLEILRAGHERFRRGEPRPQSYTPDDLREIATNQRPLAAIVACSDSRVAPEIIFDQPLGGIFASRVPGNVASDSAKWMLDIAVTELHVPLVVVLGHTRCLAVGQVVADPMGGGGGNLRYEVRKAVHRARLKGADDLYHRSVIENVALTVETLRRDSFAVQRAVERGELGLLGAYYDMDTGAVHLIG